MPTRPKDKDDSKPPAQQADEAAAEQRSGDLPDDRVGADGDERNQPDPSRVDEQDKPDLRPDTTQGHGELHPGHDSGGVPAPEQGAEARPEDAEHGPNAPDRAGLTDATGKLEESGRGDAGRDDAGKDEPGKR